MCAAAMSRTAVILQREAHLGEQVATVDGRRVLFRNVQRLFSE